MVAGWWYLHERLPAISRYQAEFHRQAIKKPWFLACILMVSTQVLFTFMPLYNLQARVYYADVAENCALWDALSKFFEYNDCDGNYNCQLAGAAQVYCNTIYADNPAASAGCQIRFVTNLSSLREG